MKLFYKYGILGCIVALGAACNDKMDVNGTETESGTPVYMTFSVDMNAGGLSARSATGDPDDDGYVTSDDGKEVGKDSENNIAEVLLIFADSEGNFIHAGTASATRIESNKYGLNFEAGQLESYKQKGDVQVYTFCNPDEGLKAAAAQWTVGSPLTSLLDKAYTLSEDESENSRAWTENRFFMSSAVPHTAYFPGTISGFSKHTPWDLGTIRVERSVARFDYRAKMTDNIYRVYDQTDGSETYSKNPGVSVQLTGIALVNMSKSFYYWRRTSNAADGYSNPVISGTETVSNYVVDTDALQKAGYTSGGWADKTNYFFYNLESPADRNFTSLSELAEAEEDEDESWNEDQQHNGYHIWRYATENTVPRMDKQQPALLTGILLRAVIIPEKGNRLESVMNEKKTIYVFDNVMYGDWEAVKEAASKGDNPSLKEAYEAVNEGMTYQEAGFTAFMPNAADGKYYSRYCYWNRHNDDKDDSKMGPMEFAVVRNNVYKLQVDALYSFGDPENPDPENPDPEDPVDPPVDPPIDPTPSGPQLKLTVKVLPWVVRDFTINIGPEIN